MKHLLRSTLFSGLLLGLFLCSACDRGLQDEPPAVAAAPAPEEDREDEPGAALPPAFPEQEETAEEERDDEADAERAREAAVASCAEEEGPGAQSDCLAEAALTAEGLSLQARSAFCDEAPRQIRCEYLFATGHERARLCDRNRFQGASTYFLECDILQVLEGSRGSCQHGVSRGYSERDDEGDRCVLSLPDQAPTTGEEVDELLTGYFVALAEASLGRVPGSECPDLMRDHALDYIQRAIDIDEQARAQFQTEPFAEALQARVLYHELTGAFDPATWEGLREVLLLSPLHAPGITAHVTPTDRLELRDDGTFHLRRNLRYSPDSPNELVESEGTWRIVSAVPGEDYAEIELDGVMYLFGNTTSPSMQYSLHPVDRDTHGYGYLDEAYFGEAC